MNANEDADANPKANAMPDSKASGSHGNEDSIANVVVSKPFDELAVKNEKYVKNCTELYMAQRGITKIGNFSRFVNLEVLWLNNNAIEELTGLDANFRIKRLYAHNNKIKSLANSSIPIFSFLQELHLRGNQLQSLLEALEVLSSLRHLEHLGTQSLFCM